MAFTGVVSTILIIQTLLRFEKVKLEQGHGPANPGEYNNAFDGKYGGMWRARGRIPSKLCGLTFTAYGFDVLILLR